MAEAKLEEFSKVLSRLEGALDRIEKKLATGGGGGSSGGPSKPWLQEWDNLIQARIVPYMDLSKKIGGDVAAQVW
jgi:hypothetical protein